MKEQKPQAVMEQVADLPEKSLVSRKLERLKTVSLSIIASRERLPQPLFWSLFENKISEIRADRKKVREKKAQIFNCDWLKY